MSSLSGHAVEFVPRSNNYNYNDFRLFSESFKFGSNCGFDIGYDNGFPNWPEVRLQSNKFFSNGSGANEPMQNKAEANRFSYFGSNQAPAHGNYGGNYYNYKHDYYTAPSTYPPIEFNMAPQAKPAPKLAPIGSYRSKASIAPPCSDRHSLSEVSSSSLNTDLKQIWTNTELDAGIDHFSEVSPSSLATDLKQLWDNSEQDACLDQHQSGSTSTEKPSTGKESTEPEGMPMLEMLVGRGASYYQRFGTNCISIPSNEPLNYPDYRKLDSFLPAREKGGFRKKQYKNVKLECAFCKNIGDGSLDYRTHCLKNNQNVITCPVLRAYTCPLCNNCGGDSAHTIRYCPLKRKKLAEEYQRAREEARMQQRNGASGNWYGGGATYGYQKYDAMRGY